MRVAEPPTRITAADVTAREYLFVVDVSGSMSGFPLEVSSQVMENLLSGLRPSDRFNILFFAGGSQTLSSVPLEANTKNISNGLQMMRNLRGGGGTQLYSAMQQALSMPRVENMSRNAVIITDGYISAEDAVFQMIDNNLNKTNVFAFGIGASVNRYLIEGIAKVGGAESFVVTNKSEALKQTERFINYISSPVLTGIELVSPNADIVDMEPKGIPDMLGERPILILGKYRPKNNQPVTFELTGATGAGPERWTFGIEDDIQDQNIAQLWARKRL